MSAMASSCPSDDCFCLLPLFPLPTQEAFGLTGSGSGSGPRDTALPPVSLTEALASQMHPDSKLANHGKAGNSNAHPESQPHQVSPPPTSHLGTKSVGGAGSQGTKVSQPATGPLALKASQAPVSVFGALKGKVRRERSVSVDSGERREATATPLDKELKGEGAGPAGGGTMAPLAPWVRRGGLASHLPPFGPRRAQCSLLLGRRDSPSEQEALRAGEEAALQWG